MRISIVLKTKGSHERNLLRFRYEREYQNAIRKMRKIIRAYRKEALQGKDQQKDRMRTRAQESQISQTVPYKKQISIASHRGED